MIGFVMVVPMAAMFLAATLVTSTLTISMGAFIGSLIAYSTAFMAFWMFILS
jgi:hypothetical protein